MCNELMPVLEKAPALPPGGENEQQGAMGNRCVGAQPPISRDGGLGLRGALDLPCSIQEGVAVVKTK